MEGSSVVRIERKSSIENEPRTLSTDQIQYAREAALYVISTRSMEEAMNFFMEGLEPVENVSRKNDDDDDDRVMESQEELQYLQVVASRDVASAPF